MTSPQFDEVVLTHLDAAYNLAAWLLRDRQAAEDVVQDAMLRALTYFHSYQGRNARAWVLQIVRNAAFEHLRFAKGANTVSIDSAPNAAPEDDAAAAIHAQLIDPTDGPEIALIKARSREQIASALEKLPVELRECIVLREFEELSYKEIAQVTDAPIGTIMSRLWRARQLLLQTFLAEGY